MQLWFCKLLWTMVGQMLLKIRRLKQQNQPFKLSFYEHKTITFLYDWDDISQYKYNKMYKGGKKYAFRVMLCKWRWLLIWKELKWRYQGMCHMAQYKTQFISKSNNFCLIRFSLNLILQYFGFSLIWGDSSISQNTGNQKINAWLSKCV